MLAVLVSPPARRAGRAAYASFGVLGDCLSGCRVVEQGQPDVVDGLGEIPAYFHRTETGVFTLATHNPEMMLVNTAEWADEPATAGPIDLAEMQSSVERVLGVPVSLAPPPEGAPTLLRRLVGRNTRLASAYRAGRIFIAGDAAHVGHGPTLNLALQDAANLAWKLAAAARGGAPDALLDSYESERRPVAEREIMWTQAESALMAPGAEVTALRGLFGELLARPANLRDIAALIGGTDLPYDVGVPDEPAGWFVPPLTVTVDGQPQPQRLAELLRDGSPFLLDLTGKGELNAGPIRTVKATTDDGPAPALLIRPDGYVAWAGSDQASLQTAVARWFG